ncbi:hypothetical protein ABW20_dc0100301 [Dactylellina cionopaga]|nr:hypothetical protein ABW20_dc0100301 [Dactylellina cionopaga]
MAEKLSFDIKLEYDPAKNSELGNAGSKLKPVGTESGTTKLDDPAVASLEGGSGTGKTSYLSLTPTTIQPVRPNHTLFVWHAAFHPSVGRRFQSVVISFKFSDSQPASSLRIIGHAPRRSFGGSTHESRKTTWGLELPLLVTATQTVQVGLVPPVEKEGFKEVDPAFMITGTARGAPRKTTCVWTIEENASSQRGVPSEMQFALLVNHTSPVQCDINVSAWTAGGIMPPHYLKTRTSPENRRKLIDPSKYAGVLHEYASGRDGLDCESLLANWTGAVEGTVLEFGQSAKSESLQMPVPVAELVSDPQTESGASEAIPARDQSYLTLD